MDKLQRRVVELIDKAGAVASQARLERMLGLSPRYLSQVRHGRRRPSALLLAALALVAADPEKAVDVLELGSG